MVLYSYKYFVGMTVYFYNKKLNGFRQIIEENGCYDIIFV